MKNKGTIKFFAIALAVVSLFHLSFTLVTYLKEKRAKEYAESTVTRYKQQNPEATNDQIDSVFKYHEDEYLDSIAFQNVYNILLKKYTYAECKERELNLGLDLQGGMHITLEVSLEDLLRELSNNSTDSVFLKAIESARENGFLDFRGQLQARLAPNGVLSSFSSVISSSHICRNLSAQLHMIWITSL